MDGKLDDPEWYVYGDFVDIATKPHIESTWTRSSSLPLLVFPSDNTGRKLDLRRTSLTSQQTSHPRSDECNFE